MAENPPAFPCEELRNTSSDPFATPRTFHHPGMTLRDWFAGQALSGGLAAADNLNFSTPEHCARHAYQIADALLAQREKPIEVTQGQIDAAAAYWREKAYHNGQVTCSLPGGFFWCELIEAVLRASDR